MDRIVRICLIFSLGPALALNWPTTVTILQAGDNMSKTTTKSSVFMLLPGNKHTLDIQADDTMHYIGLGKHPWETQIQSVSAPLGTSNVAMENVFVVGKADWQVSGFSWLRNMVATYLSFSQSGDPNEFQLLKGAFLSQILSGQCSGGKSLGQFARNVFCSWSFTVAQEDIGPVFYGSKGNPTGKCSNTPGERSIIEASSTPVTVEKPFITSKDGTDFFLQVPKRQEDSTGFSLKNIEHEERNFTGVFVATPDTAKEIPGYLETCHDIVLTPGNYILKDTLVLGCTGQVMLGMGFPTLYLYLTKGLTVTASGVRLSGMGLKLYSKLPTPALLVNPSNSSTLQANPIVLQDMFVETIVCEKDQPSVDVRADYTILENVWIQGCTYNTETKPVGLQVSGKKVLAMKVRVEALARAVEWNGSLGHVAGFSSEIPCNADAKDVLYSVSTNVTTHTCRGCSAQLQLNCNSQINKIFSSNETCTFESASVTSLDEGGHVSNIVNDDGYEVSGVATKYDCVGQV